MVLLPCTLGRAGPLCSEIPDLQVVERGRDTGVLTGGSESDAPRAPRKRTAGAVQRR